MSKLCLLCVLFIVVFAFAIGQTEAAAGRESRRVKRQGYNSFDSDLGEYPQYDVDLMQRVFKTPLKRQWCRSGMSFNPVIGTCTLSLAAMRGRGRGFRV